MSDHFSQSQLNMGLRCLKQYEFRYMKGLIIPPSGALILGKSWHGAMEKNYKQKIESDEDLKISDMKDIFSEKFDEAKETEEVDWQDEKPGAIKDQGISITEIHHKEIAPKVKPKLVEHRFEMPFTEDHTLVGYIDLIEKDGQIVDHKSSKISPNDGDVSKSIQLTAYSMAYRHEFKKKEPNLRLDVVVKNKTPKTVQKVTTRDQSSFDILREIGVGLESNIKAGNFPPNPTSYLCSEKWCGFWDLCMGKKEKSIFTDMGTK